MLYITDNSAETTNIKWGLSTTGFRFLKAGNSRLGMVMSEAFQHLLGCASIGRELSEADLPLAGAFI